MGKMRRFVRLVYAILAMESLYSRTLRPCLRWITLLFYGRVVTKKIRGIRYELDLSEQIDSSLYFRGYYERGTTKVLQRCVEPNMVVFEVGANIGAHTFRIAQRLALGDGRIYSFEPTEYAFRKLERNHALNRFDNIVLERMALSDVNEEKVIHRATSPETLPFQASWDKKTHTAKHASVDRIVFRRLDDYFNEKRLQRLDLLKIDTDGYELRVLEGGRQTILNHRPVIVIELSKYVELIGDRLEQVMEVIAQLGYSFHSVDTSSEFGQAELLEAVREQCSMDCLCLPKAA
jgi:FkbM family methyltransferase